MKARASAHPNIALVKYWGKRCGDLNLPAAGSLSLTLAGVGTETTVELGTDGTSSVHLDGALVEGQVAARVLGYVGLIWQLAAEAGQSKGPQGGVTVESCNSFPTAAGLASSSSGFSALAAATTAALGWKVAKPHLSMLARRGSGSAARSVFGGFVEMLAGGLPDGSDSFARPLYDESHWDLNCLIALTAEGPKRVSSTDGMKSTALSSPYYRSWVDSVPDDIKQAREAVGERDIAKLGAVAERSCLRMHASAMASEPGILFWNGLTVELIHRVRDMRATGQPVFFTVDAGPHVKVFCPASNADEVQGLLGEMVGLERVIKTRPGPGVSLLDEPA